MGQEVILKQTITTLVCKLFVNEKELQHITAATL